MTATTATMLFKIALTYVALYGTSVAKLTPSPVRDTTNAPMPMTTTAASPAHLRRWPRWAVRRAASRLARLDWLFVMSSPSGFVELVVMGQW